MEFSAIPVAALAGRTEVTVGGVIAATTPPPPLLLLLPRQPTIDDISSNAMSHLTGSVKNLDIYIILSLIFHTKKHQRN
jgi:hypothetical protein